MSKWHEYYLTDDTNSPGLTENTRQEAQAAIGRCMLEKGWTEMKFLGWERYHRPSPGNYKGRDWLHTARFKCR